MLQLASNNSIIIIIIINNSSITMEHTNYNTITSYSCNDEDTTIVNVPFSWEHKPGLSRVTNGYNGTTLVIQPPPCSTSGFGSDHRNKVEENTRNILCAVQNSLRISSFRMESTQKEEDPFVEAYKKCTQSPFIHQQGHRVQKNHRSWPTIRKCVNILSCKDSNDVCSHKAVFGEPRISPNREPKTSLKSI